MRVHLAAPIVALLLSHLPAAAHRAADVVKYTCTTTGTSQPQSIEVTVELTVPPTAGPRENLTIGWKGSYAGGTQLLAPTTGLDDGLNLYAYAGISGIPGLTSATGVARLGTIAPGAPIPLPTTTVNLTTTTPQTEDAGTVHVASINFGPSPQEPLIECEIPEGEKAARTEYRLRVGAGDATTGPSPDATDTNDEGEDEEQDTTTTPEATTTTNRTPVGGADTGAGGEAGPDGRALLLVGSLLVLSSATGLALRRRGRQAAPGTPAPRPPEG